MLKKYSFGTKPDYFSQSKGSGKQECSIGDRPGTGWPCAAIRSPAVCRRVRNAAHQNISSSDKAQEANASETVIPLCPSARSIFVGLDRHQSADRNITYLRFSGLRHSNSSITNRPSLRIITSSNHTSPPPISGVCTSTRSQWTALSLPL